MSIPVSKVVNVSILTSPTFPKRKGFGLLLIIGDSEILPDDNRIRFYSDMDGVAEDFSSNDEEYKAAQVFFSQAPRPTEIAIGRRLDGESIADTLDALQNIDPSWYGFTFTGEVSTEDLLAAAAWAEARVKIFGFTTNDNNVPDQAADDDICSTLKANLYSRTVAIWDNDDPYQICSVFARAFVVNFNGQNTTITLKFKTLPGTTPTHITETQRQALVKKNCNYYTYFGDSAMLAEGVMASGQFFDERHGLDWLQNAIETNVFGYLYTRTTKVPQTDKGVAALVQQTEKALQEGVTNGLLAPGVWNGDDLGEIASGDYLPKGFYVYASPVATQNQSDREARKAPPIQVIAKGAGAIHFVDIAVTFER